MLEVRKHSRHPVSDSPSGDASRKASSSTSCTVADNFESNGAVKSSILFDPSFNAATLPKDGADGACCVWRRIEKKGVDPALA